MTGNKQNNSDTREGSEFRFQPIKPQPIDQLPPCGAHCPSGTNVRDWIAIIAQRPLGEDEQSSYTRAWNILVEHNPFPATMGRICPHPCEADCNRSDKDGAVAINSLERFIGDWAIAQNLSLPVLIKEAQPESIGVIGAGPAGLSFAYQMSRRGYPVTVYDSHSQAGGMLRYGIPDYRLPPAVLDAELGRILDLGVTLVNDVQAGTDIKLKTLQARHKVLFLGLGAQLGRHLDLEGEDSNHIWGGTEFLAAHNRGDPPSLGEHIVVVGGGNTAIDAARVARRTGADVSIIYRRERGDMSAIDEEVSAAIEEGVDIHYRGSPTALIRDESGVMTGIRVQRMRPGAPDESGRAVPEAVPGEEFTMLASALITAISQQSDWHGLESLAPKGPWLQFGAGDSSDVVGGGDVTGLDLASHAIGQGKIAAERVHVSLRGLAEPASIPQESRIEVKSTHYDASERVFVPQATVDQRMGSPDDELSETISEQEFLHEIGRCFSCGLCNGCQLCWMYCGGHGFTRLDSPSPGHYFAFSADACEGCGKCIELCPTGYLNLAE